MPAVIPATIRVEVILDGAEGGRILSNNSAGENGGRGGSA